MSKKAKYTIKFTNKKTGEVSYYRTFHSSSSVINGVKCSYTEYDLTSNIEAAFLFDSAISAHCCIGTIKTNQPGWCDNFTIEPHRIPGRREQIALDMSPLKVMVSLVRGYHNASIKGKMAIRKKLFQRELIEACLASLDDINKLK